MVPHRLEAGARQDPSVATEDFLKGHRSAEVLAFGDSVGVVEVVDNWVVYSPHERPRVEGIEVEDSLEAVAVPVAIAPVAVAVVVAVAVEAVQDYSQACLLHEKPPSAIVRFGFEPQLCSRCLQQGALRCRERMSGTEKGELPYEKIPHA